jgi:hypothetical protein
MAILNPQSGSVAPRKGLVPISVRELVEAQVLPGHLRDREGRILIPAGAVLNEDDLLMLTSRQVYVGPDWLANRARMMAAGGGSDPAGRPTGMAAGEELREQLRRVWNTTLDLELTEQDGSRRRQVRVQTLNLSSGGFAFLHRQFIHPGTRVWAEFQMLPGRPIIEGVVRSCDQLGGMEHRVGVQFIASAGRSEADEQAA